MANAGNQGPYTAPDNGTPTLGGYTVENGEGYSVIEFNNGKAAPIFYPNHAAAQAVAAALSNDDSAYIAAIRGRGLHPFGASGGGGTIIAQMGALRIIVDGSSATAQEKTDSLAIIAAVETLSLLL